MIHCRIAVINVGIPHLRNDIASVIFFQQGLSLALASQEVPFNPAGIVWDSCPGPRWGVLVKSNLPKNISHRVIENIKVLFGIWQFHISSDINWNQDLISTSVEQHYLLIIWHEGLWWQSLEALYSASSTGSAGSVTSTPPPKKSISISDIFQNEGRDAFVAGGDILRDEFLSSLHLRWSQKGFPFRTISQLNRHLENQSAPLCLENNC